MHSTLSHARLSFAGHFYRLVRMRMSEISVRNIARLKNVLLLQIRQATIHYHRVSFRDGLWPK